MPRLLLLLLLVCTAASASAQDRPAPPEAVQRVVLVDGTVLVGRVVEDSADAVVVVAANGVEQRVARDQVAEVTDLLGGRFTRYDPARTRLFFSPTARSLGSGARRFSAYYLFPSLAVGVGDRVDLSVGASIPLVVPGLAATVLNGNVKATLVQREGVAAAVGGSVLVPISTEGTPGVGGTIYGVVTIGGEAGAVTLGAYGFYATDFSDSEFGNGTAILIGLERQVSNNIKLVSENYVGLVFEEGGAVGVGTLTGVRFFGDQLAADVAVAFGVAEGEFSSVPVPYLGLSYTF
ncbi:hypothetical protein RQM47_06120 [Rubrivirga sp. S365]|uniref:Transporter n=1 Tax=Rubrivirga litoralis TaxID=3075598 RepID=A0ABU3BUS7_9BACT|nr:MULTISPECIES: hypothetical protein [unclassified Rubrivirga]MDT0633040.1 hypothetical protein [Rubrivirga sp. F394]MDT7856208.1 hypothetical protein [Rubrivirga sp. S365]